ncbi:MAG: winged helix-turn-helix domain-containing protein [Candidatus Bathyarchaeota archaeon]|nr:winged helix-turn-helix domain-containing protein [Candidatus Termiticorpusculum sp.]
MAKDIFGMFHPNAYLRKVRNVQCGLKTRTKILLFLDNQYCSTGELADKTGFSYNVVLYHLRLLCREGIVEHKGHRRYVWLSTGVGQTRLV